MPVASKSRFQASLVQKTHPTPSRGKRLRGTPTSPPHSFGGRGAQSFPSPRRWMPWIRIALRKYTWTCLLSKPDPLPQINIIIGMIDFQKHQPYCRLPSPFPTLGKEQGKTSGKNIGTVTELESAIQKLCSCPSGIPQNPTYSLKALMMTGF